MSVVHRVRLLGKGKSPARQLDAPVIELELEREQVKFVHAGVPYRITRRWQESNTQTRPIDADAMEC